MLIHLACTVSSSILHIHPPCVYQSANRVAAFDASLLYDHLYKTHLVRATAVRRSQRIRGIFSALVTESVDRGLSTARSHKLFLQQNRGQWMQLRSNRTCLFCLRRAPEHVLSCGHAACEVCIRIFGEITGNIDHQYHIPNCHFCPAGNLTVNIKPPTAGIRILTIDGGGVRGIVPLEFLMLLQETVGTAIPVRDLFDLAVGTSSGEVPS